MIVMKIKLTQDELGALHADFIGGMNSVSQNNESNNYIEATLDGFKVNVDDGEILEISYATTLNESDAETDNVGYTMMSYNADRETWSIEVDPIVLARRGEWYLSLRVATYLEGKRVGASKSVENLEFTVNADIYNSNGEYPNKGDVATVYQNALKSEAVAKEAVTAAATAMEAAEGVLKTAVKKTGDTMTGPLTVENSRSLGRSGVLYDGFHVQSGEEAETHYGQGFILRKADTNAYPNGTFEEIVNALPQESGTLATEEKARAIANEEITKDAIKNIQDGTGNGAIQQVADGVSDGFNFTGKNANATALEPTLTGIIPYGATGEFASAFGGKCAAIGKRSMAQGTTTIAKGKYSHAEGDNSVSLGDDSHAEGYTTVTGVDAQAAHAEGINTQALGKASHSEGEDTKASNIQAHAEGVRTTASGGGSHAEGADTIASGWYSHSEGYITTASGQASHAEGASTSAVGDGAHAEGEHCTANGNASHAGGSGAIADGTYSFAHGNKVIAGQHNQSVFGRFNDNNPANIFEIGNGENDDHRSNAFEVRYNGEAYAGGKKLLREGEASGGGGTQLYLHTIGGQYQHIFIVTTRQQPFTTLLELYTNCPNDYGHDIPKGFVSMFYWGGETIFTCVAGTPYEPIALEAYTYTFEEGFTDTVTEL